MEFSGQNAMCCVCVGVKSLCHAVEDKFKSLSTHKHVSRAKALIEVARLLVGSAR